MPDALAALRELGITLSPSAGQPLRGICFRDAETAVAAGFPIRRGHLARRVARKLVAIGCSTCFRVCNFRQAAAHRRASSRARAARARRPAAPECADRRAAARCVYPVADAVLGEARCADFSPRGRRALRAGAGRLLRRARRRTAELGARDPGLRPRRHQPFRRGEPVSRLVERARDGAADRGLLPAGRVGRLPQQAVRVRDAVYG